MTTKRSGQVGPTRLPSVVEKIRGLWTLRTKTVALCAFFAVAALAMAGLMVQRAERQAVELALRHLQEALDVRAARIESLSKHYARDALLLSRLPALLAVVADVGSADRRQALEQSFAALARSRIGYRQIRYISADGMEIVRVNAKDGELAFVSGDALQNKSHRPYFVHGSQQSEGKVHVSPMTLNIEHKQIEVPHLPMLRFAAPVFDAETNVRRGCVVINVDGEVILSSSFAFSEDPLYLADQEGSYLHHPDQRREFGGQLGTGFGLPSEHPQLWKQAQQGPSSVRHDAEVGYVNGLRRVHFDPYRADRYWTLWCAVPEERVWAEVHRGRRALAAVGLSVVLLVAVLGFVWARSITKPIRKLRRATGRLVAEDGVRVAANAMDEIGDLGRAFNAMADQLQKQRDALRRYEHIVASSSDLMALLDENFICLAVNPAYLDAFGKSADQVVGHSASLAFGEAFFEQVVRPHAVRSLAGESVRFDARVEVAGVGLRDMDVCYSPYRAEDGEICGIVVNVRDVTELRATQAQLVQAGKLAAVGELAGGLAHELGNPLTSVTGFASLALQDLEAGKRPEASVLTDWFNTIHEEGMRCKSIIDNLLQFARAGGEKCCSVKVAEVFNKTLKLVSVSLREAHVTVESQLADEQVYANPNELQQIFTNLLVNAAQALAKQGGAVVVGATLDAPEYVTIRVRDDGPGIDPDLIPRLFEPFFTTKPVGMGTGLGLSIVHGLVESNGGHIWVESKIGVGTTFRFTLPTSPSARVVGGASDGTEAS